MRISAAIAVAASLAAAVSGAQEKTPIPGFVSELKVNNVTVDVQVRDAQGVPVEGLRKADFRVFEDGHEQGLTNFLAVQGGQVAESADASMVGQPAPREVVIFFDLYLMTQADKDMILRGLEEQLAGGLPPAMAVAVVSYDGTLRVHTPPTASHARVMEALKEVGRTPATGLAREIKLASFNTADSRWRESYSGYEMRRTMNAEYWDEMRRMVGRVESAFAATVERFAGTQARKVVILVSPGFPRAQNLPLYRPYDFFLDAPVEYRNEGLLGRAASLASELEYTLYTLDSSGNQTIDNTTASAGRPPRFSDVANVAFWREADRKDTLIKAAKLTGGEAIFSADGGAALSDVERLTASFYSLGYQPEHYGDGKSHAIKVEVVAHPEFKLTYRTSYVDRPFEQREAERAQAALLMGDKDNPLGIELVLDRPTSHFHLGAQGMRLYKVPAELRIPYARLVMIPRGDVAWGQVQVVVVAVDKAGNLSDLTHQRVPIEVPAARLEEARKRGYFAYRFAVEVEGGEHSLRIAVDDVLAHTTSTLLADLRY